MIVCTPAGSNAEASKAKAAISGGWDLCLYINSRGDQTILKEVRATWMYQKICVYFAIFWLRKLNLLRLSEEFTPIKKWSASLNTLYYLLATRYLKWVSCLIRRSAKAHAVSVAVECSSDCYPQSILRPSLMGGIYLLKWFAKKSNPRIPIDIESRISNIESPLIMNRFERETSIINSLKTTSLTAQSYGESLWARRM